MEQPSPEVVSDVEKSLESRMTVQQSPATRKGGAAFVGRNKSST